LRVAATNKYTVGLCHRYRLAKGDKTSKSLFEQTGYKNRTMVVQFDKFIYLDQFEETPLDVQGNQDLKLI